MNKKKPLILLIMLSMCMCMIYINWNNQQTSEDVVDIGTDETPMGSLYVLDSESIESIQKIQALEKNLSTKLETDDITVINNGVMSLLRRERYGYYTKGASMLLWERFAGMINSECGVSMAEAEEMCKDELVDIKKGIKLLDPITKDEIDFIHMIAVIDVNYTDVATEEYKETYYDYLLTWGGDLETLRINLSDHVEKHKDESYEAYYEYAINTIGSDVRSYFSKEDMLADIDGVNLSDMMVKGEMLLSDAMMNYYSSPSVCDRNQLFVSHYGGQEAFEKEVFSFMKNGVGSQYENDASFKRFMEGFKELKNMVYEKHSSKTILKDQVSTNALSSAFIDKIGQSY